MGEGTTPFIAGNAAKAVAAAGFILPTALVLMFIGGAGKSAMFPLHIWLPDAMEGPTPVSALIHAATMVVAGVFQIARMFPLWVEYAQPQMSIVVWVGVFTAFYAAAVACAQTDIKRVLAFSTISQIAFMMVALGVCTEQITGHEHPGSVGYLAGMFHLFTHAMFKACLFLGAGCIIHAVHSNEMALMGGLRKYMPITHITFLISCLAIAGIPFFSGFSSKDEIISACMNYSPVVGWIMTGIAAMTAFYMFRLYYVIFWGKSYYEADPENRRKPQEVPAIMWGPLVFLCIVGCLCGLIPFGHFVSLDGAAEDIAIQTFAIWTWPSVAWVSIVVALVGIGLSTWMYKSGENPVPDMLKRKMPKLHEAALQRFYIDNAWQFFTHKIVFRCFSMPIAWFDRHVIDGTFNFAAWGTQEAGETLRPWQSGDVRSYASWFLMGTVALTVFLLCILL